MDAKKNFIPRDVYPAVMFARKLIKEGMSGGLAIYKSANYYSLDTSYVAQWLKGKGPSTQKKVKTKKWIWVIRNSFCEATGYSFPSARCFITDMTPSECKKIQALNDLKETRNNDYGGSYASDYFSIVSKKRYDDFKECLADLKENLISEFKSKVSECADIKITGYKDNDERYHFSTWINERDGERK